MEVCEDNTYEEHYVFEYKWKTNNFLEKKRKIKNTKEETYEVNTNTFKSHNGNYLWILRLICEKEDDTYCPGGFIYSIEVQCNNLTNIFHEKKIEIVFNLAGLSTRFHEYNNSNCILEDCVNSKKNRIQIHLFNDLYFSLGESNQSDITITFRIFEPFSPAINIPEMHRLSCDYEELLKSGNNSDFKIIIGKKEFLVHKLILATRSEYFSLMFKYDANEQARSSTLEISDVNHAVMTEMLQYIYCAKFNIAKELTYDLLTAADMYQINDLKKKCEQLIITNLKTSNVGECMAYAERYNNDSLKIASVNFLTKFASEFSEDDKNLLKASIISIASPFITSLVYALLFKNEQIMV